jgi:hypothetical protein
MTPTALRQTHNGSVTVRVVLLVQQQQPLVMTLHHQNGLMMADAFATTLNQRDSQTDSSDALVVSVHAMRVQGLAVFRPSLRLVQRSPVVTQGAVAQAQLASTMRVIGTMTMVVAVVNTVVLSAHQQLVHPVPAARSDSSAALVQILVMSAHVGLSSAFALAQQLVGMHLLLGSVGVGQLADVEIASRLGRALAHAVTQQIAGSVDARTMTHRASTVAAAAAMAAMTKARPDSAELTRTVLASMSALDLVVQHVVGVRGRAHTDAQRQASAAVAAGSSLGTAVAVVRGGALDLATAKHGTHLGGASHMASAMAQSHTRHSTGVSAMLGAAQTLDVVVVMAALSSHAGLDMTSLGGGSSPNALSGMAVSTAGPGNLVLVMTALVLHMAASQTMVGRTATSRMAMTMATSSVNRLGMMSALDTGHTRSVVLLGVITGILIMTATTTMMMTTMTTAMLVHLSGMRRALNRHSAVSVLLSGLLALSRRVGLAASDHGLVSTQRTNMMLVIFVTRLEMLSISVQGTAGDGWHSRTASHVVISPHGALHDRRNSRTTRQSLISPQRAVWTAVLLAGAAIPIRHISCRASGRMRRFTGRSVPILDHSLGTTRVRDTRGAISVLFHPLGADHVGALARRSVSHLSKSARTMFLVTMAVHSHVVRMMGTLVLSVAPVHSALGILALLMMLSMLAADLAGLDSMMSTSDVMHVVRMRVMNVVVRVMRSLASRQALL